MKLLLISFLFFAVVDGFTPFASARAGFRHNAVISSAAKKSEFRLASSNPDLFSDDLFSDDDDNDASSEKKIATSKNNYLDEQWKLSEEDEINSNLPEKVVGEDVNVPCFALLYRFRSEYNEMPMEEILKDHEGEKAEFKRIINTEILNMGKHRGAVLMWAGLAENDKDATKEEAMRFMTVDPFIKKDIVEDWELVDISDDDDEEDADDLVDAEGKPVEAFPDTGKFPWF
jgi:hypothetical protein